MLNNKNNFENSHKVCRQNGGGLAEIPDRLVDDAVNETFG